MDDETIVYQLYFFHASTKTHWAGSYDLGFYSTREEVEKAIAQYRKLPGFSNYKDGYLIHPYHMDGSVAEPLMKVYLSAIHIQDEQLCLDEIVKLGVFTTEEQMRAETDLFYTFNPKATKNGDVMFKDISRCYVLNKMLCDEGFTPEKRD